MKKPNILQGMGKKIKRFTVSTVLQSYFIIAPNEFVMYFVCGNLQVNFSCLVHGNEERAK